MTSASLKPIEKVYFITHPHFPLVAPPQMNIQSFSWVDFDRYFQNYLKTIAINVQHNPNALLVFIPTLPRIHETNQKSEIPTVPKVSGKIQQREEKWITYFQRLLKDRLIVAPHFEFSHRADAVAVQVKAMIQKKGFNVRKATVEGYGSWLEACARHYPLQFLIAVKGKRVNSWLRNKKTNEFEPYWWRKRKLLSIPEGGSISLDPNKGFKALRKRKIPSLAQPNKPKRV